MNKNPVVRVAFLDVGQGDTIAISIPQTKEAVIVDCNDANTAIKYLEHENIQHLRGVLITHLHLDHYGGVIQLLNNLEHELNLDCERVFFHRPALSKSLRDAILNDEDGHSDGESDETTRLRKRKNSIIDLLRWAKLNKEHYNNLSIQPGISLPLEGVIELIHPWEIDIPDLLSHGLNNTSGVIKVFGENSSVLLTGDIEPIGWSKLNQHQLQSDVLKFPHHGAWKDDNVGQLLDIVKPSLVVISVGTSGIRYDHPNSHVFNAISQLPEIRLMCTQATEKCSKRIKEIQSDIVDAFEQESKRNNDFFFFEQRGCPCAGTIIIELSDSVHVLQPQTTFHQNQIIKSNYDNPQCKFDS